MSNKQRQSLGKGFDILMPQGVDSVLSDSQERVQHLSIQLVQPNPDQPRRVFDEVALLELADSIKEHGVLQPIIVTPLGNSEYKIVAGERRWRASQLAGQQTIPAIVRTVQQLELLEVALIENIQRVDLSPLEEAESIKRLHEQFNMTMEQIAKRLGKAVSTVSNTQRLLTLPPAAIEALHAKRITEGHARSILALKDVPEQQEKLLLLIQKNDWSVRQAEQFVTATKQGAENSKVATKKTTADTPETKRLSAILKRPVTVTHMAKGGRLVIRFENDQDLDRLIKLLSDLKKA